MLDDREVVRDEQDAQAQFVLQGPEQFEDGRLDGHVEGGDRFVGDEHVGSDRQRPRDRQPLALAAGELARVRVQRVLLQADPVEQPDALGADLAGGTTRWSRSSPASIDPTLILGLSEE